MKKKYLISLLGLAAISISFGNAFSSTPSSPITTSSEESASSNSNLSEEELDTIEKYQNDDNYFGWTIKQASMGNKSSAAIINDPDGYDHLYTWGLNDWGQLGLSDDFISDKPGEEYSSTPQEVTKYGIDEDNNGIIVDNEITEIPDNIYIDQISMGEDFAAALVNDKMYTWGHNQWGQLGNGIKGSWNYEDSNNTNATPQAVHDTEEFENNNIEQILLGDCFSMAVVNGEGENDTLYSWGHDDQGQLGAGPKYVNTGDRWESRSLKPLKVLLPAGDIEQISTGHDVASAVVSEDGENNQLYTWGYNNVGQLGRVSTEGDGDGDQHEGGEYSSTPDLVTDGDDKGFINENIKQVSIGLDHSSVLLDSGEFYTWGNNEHGELGLGADYVVENGTAGKKGSHADFPQLVSRSSGGLPEGNIDKIAMGAYAGSAVVDNTLYTWGNDHDGQLGVEGMGGQYKDDYLVSADNGKPILPSPHEVTDLPEGTIEQLIMEDDQSGALVDNKLYTWGLNMDGQLGHGDNTSPIVVPEIVPTEMPYLINIETEANQVEEGSKSTTIDYSFETNIIQFNEDATVDTHVSGDGKKYEFQGSEVTDASSQNDLYTGSQTITIDPEDKYGEFTYTMDLNYVYNFDDEAGEVKLEDFITGDFVLQGEEQPPELSQDGVVEFASPTTASIKYDVTPEATDKYGNPMTLTEVQWIDEDITGDDKSLASNSDGKSSGELSHEWFKPSVTHANTKLVAKYIEPDGEEQEIVTPVTSFTLPSAATKTTINQPIVPYDITPYGASIDYEVIPGNDQYGEQVGIAEVRWMNGTDVLASAKEGNASGTLKTNELDPNQTYDATTLEVDVIGEGSIPFTPVNVGEFQTDTGDESSSITQTNPVDVISSTEASVTYEVTPGKDVDGIDVTTKQVQWIDKKGNAIATNDVTNGIDGTLEATKLKANRNYKNTTIIAEMSDGSKTNVVPIEDFKTAKANTKSKIDADPETVIKGPNEASVTYEVALGTNAWGNRAITKKVQWIDSDGSTVIAEDVATMYDGIDGTLEATGLEPNTNYKDTYIIATMGDGSTTNKSIVNDFTTSKANSTAPEMEVVVNNITDSAATFDYHGTNGKDADDNNYNLTEIRIIDTKGHILYDSDDLDGTFTIANLDSNTSYDDWTMISTFNNTGDSTGVKEQKEFTTIDPFTTMYAAPILNEPNLMQANQTNGTLEVQGSIIENDVEVTDVIILKDGEIIPSTSTLEPTNKNNEISYDVLTTDYDNSSKYELKIVYSFEEQSNLKSDPYLLNQDNFIFTDSNPATTVHPWIIVGTSIGVLVFAWFSMLIGIVLFKHYRKGNQF